MWRFINFYLRSHVERCSSQRRIIHSTRQRQTDLTDVLVFNNTCRQSEKKSWETDCVQLTIKSDSSSSWLVILRKNLHKYDIPSALHLLDNPSSKNNPSSKKKKKKKKKSGKSRSTKQITHTGDKRSSKTVYHIIHWHIWMLISEPEFYGDLVYRFRKIVGKSKFSEQFVIKELSIAWILCGRLHA